MSALDSLLACAGAWLGTSRLQDPHHNIAEDSPSTLTVLPVLGGRFVRLDYTWAYHGAPQEGSILVGYQSETGTVTAHWVDTWHMGNVVMACAGSAAADDSISVRGSYAAPTGPDWGWRISLAASDERTLRIVMFNIHPDGREDLAVAASYSRVVQ